MSDQLIHSNDCYIVTYSGKRVNPLKLKVDDIEILDIAHSHALTNRWLGHTQFPITLAQHCIHVSQLVFYKMNTATVGINPRLGALQGLLHDAAEAYLGDVTKWLKLTPVMEGYRKAEYRAEAVIFQRFDLPAEVLQWVSWADKFMVRFEATQAYLEYPISTAGYEPLSEKEWMLFEAATGEDPTGWVILDWQTAKHRFIKHFTELQAALGRT